MKHRTYEYPNVYVKRQNKFLILDVSENSGISFEQKKMFCAILNFGDIPFAEGVFKLTDSQIVEFWKYSKTSVFKNINIEKFYLLLNIASPYMSQIPTIKTDGAFFSDSYKMTVTWINDTSTGKMATAPKAYICDGLEVFNFENEKLGSIYPEYFELYKIVDEANISWKNWNKKEKYNFLEKLDALSKIRKIIIPDSLEQSFEYMQKN